MAHLIPLLFTKDNHLDQFDCTLMNCENPSHL